MPLAISGIAVFVVGYLVLYTPALRLFIGSISLGEHQLSYKGKTGKFILLNIIGIVLSIVTIGIYSPWYVKKLIAYITGNIYRKGMPVNFEGSGKRLFIIMLLSLFLPMLVLGLIVYFIALSINSIHALNLTTNLFQIVYYIILIPYFYYMIRWELDFSYGSYSIRLEARPLEAMGALLKQILLSMITLGNCAGEQVLPRQH